VGNIVQQDCVQAYTSGPHSVSLSDGVGIYAANGGSAITFNLQNLRKLHVLAVIEKARAKRAANGDARRDE
jgi:hypothetical protein